MHQPEAGPLELYQRHFPGRVVEWDGRRELWAIYEVHGDHKDRVEFVFDWYHPPRPGGVEYTEEEIGDLVMRGVPTVVRRFRPFDYRFVNERIRNRSELQSQGSQRYMQGMRERNQRRRSSLLRGTAAEGAAYINEMKRYLPTLAGESPVPLVVGANFLTQGGIDAFRGTGR